MDIGYLTYKAEKKSKNPENWNIVNVFDKQYSSMACKYPADTRRNNNVIVTSKQRHKVVLV